MHYGIKGENSRKNEEKMVDQIMDRYSPSKIIINVYIKYTELTFIDGQKGIMRYRGYDINELAEKSSFEKVSYLMLFPLSILFSNHALTFSGSPISRNCL